MNKYDKDNMWCSIAMYNHFEKWAKSSKSELGIKDRKKLNLITQTLQQLFNSISRQEGNETFIAMMNEGKNYDFLIAPKDAKVGEQITGTFENAINESVIKQVLDSNDCECWCCTRDNDYTKCGWYALHSLVEPHPTNCHGCPYKKSLLDFIQHDETPFTDDEIAEEEGYND